MTRLFAAASFLVFALGSAPASAQLDPWALATVPIVTGAAIERAVIGAHIIQLGDDSWRAREAASAALTAIGRPALPAIRRARASEDAEVRRRAARIYNGIMGQIADAPELPEPILRRAEALRSALEASGRGLKGAPTAGWLSAQERLVRQTDALLSQEAGGLDADEVAVRLRVFRNEPPERLGFQAQERNRQALIFLAEAAAVSRLGLARAYSLSEDPDQKKKALDHLIQVIRLFPDDYMRQGTYMRRGDTLWESFMDIAVRAGARNDPAFQRALPRDSAADTLQRLEQLERPAD